MSSPLLARLVEVVDALSAADDVPALLQRILGNTQDLLRAFSVSVAVLEPPDVVVVASTGPHVELVGRRFPLVGSAVEELLASGRRSLQAEGGRFSHLDEELFHGGAPLGLAVALTRSDGRGALYVLRDDVLSADELGVLELLAASAGAALRSAQTYGQADAERREKDAVIEAMADGLAVLDASGLVRTWNRALVEMTGIAASDVLGCPAPLPLPAVGQVLDHELPSGLWIEILVAGVDGTRDRVVGVRDVSRPKAIEAAKDLFLATASHELRTPLTVLRGFGETLLNYWDVLSDERRQELVGTILTRTQAMTGLVEQLLLGSRAGIGVDVQVRPFDLAASVRQAAAAISGSRPSHPLVVSAPGPVMAHGDEETVDAVLGQLVENAVKYSPDGGPIDITVRSIDGEAVLQVADTGVGIAPQDLGRVFDRFVRTEPRGSDDPGGAGLGLWIVRRYLDAQGGRVSASARPGGGTVIDVRLPMPPGSTA